MNDIRKKIAQKAHDALEARQHHGLLCMAMRSGKTKVTIDYIHKHQDKIKSVLWVTPETKLRDIDIPAEFEKWKRKTLFKRVTTVCYSSLNKVKGHYDLIVLDEYQSITENNVTTIMNGSLSYNSIIGLSGTHPKGKTENAILADLGLKIVYELTIDEASELGIISPYTVHVVFFELESSKPTILVKRTGKYITERRRYDQFNYIIYNKMASGEDASSLFHVRMQLLYGLESRQKALKKVLDSQKNKRGVIFTPFKKTTEKLCKYYFHSTSGDEHYNLFQEGKVDQLGLVKKGGVGHTYQDLDFAIISQATSDKKGLTSQQWSRVLLPRENYKADIFILCARDTQDEQWVQSAVEKYDNIIYSDIRNFK